MFIHQLTDDECDDVLRRTNLGRLGCARDNQPYVVPIYFKFDAHKLDARYLYSFANLGQKIYWMRKNPLVCVEVDDVKDQFHWTSCSADSRSSASPSSVTQPIVRTNSCALDRTGGSLQREKPRSPSVTFRSSTVSESTA
jgi:uncharacterized protein